MSTIQTLPKFTFTKMPDWFFEYANKFFNWFYTQKNL